MQSKVVVMSVKAPHAVDRCQTAATVLGLPADGVTLIYFTLETLWQNEPNVSAVRLCEALLRCEGDTERSTEQLRRLGIANSSIVGRVVYWLVREGVIHADQAESESDFAALFQIHESERAEPR